MKRKTNKTKEEAWSQTAHAPDGEQPGPEASDTSGQSVPKSKFRKKSQQEQAAAAKLHMESQGEKLEQAREKLAKQKPPKKPGPVKRIGRVASGSVHSFVHGKIFEVEQENVGTEGAHRSELVGETALRHGSRFVRRKVREHPAKVVRKAEARYTKYTADYHFHTAAQEHPELTKNALTRYWQKQRLRRQYRKQAKEAAKQSAAAAGKTATATERLTARAVEFVKSHPAGAVIAVLCVLLLFAMQSCSSTMLMLGNAGAGALGASTYPCEDRDMLAAEAAYCALEDDLQHYLDTYESTHDYDEYHFDLDEIEHDPYVLLSLLCALHEGQWTIGEVQGTLQMLFDRQYILTEDVVVETRYRTETDTWTDEDGNSHTDTYQVPYDYYICTVTLENFDLSHVPVYVMGEDQLSRYAIYMATLGNRPDLFPDSPYVNKYITGKPGDYEVPGEYLDDETFAAMLAEAQKYIGYPYVWGGSSPATSFDCSGYVSWVINHSGWNVGRLGAQGLYNICTPTSSPKPGDLVFFKGTYDTPGVSHCGIYVGDGKMLHCGDPIQYTSIDTSYWQAHFYAFGRLSYNVDLVRPYFVSLHSSSSWDREWSNIYEVYVTDSDGSFINFSMNRDMAVITICQYDYSDSKWWAYTSVSASDNYTLSTASLPVRQYNSEGKPYLICAYIKDSDGVLVCSKPIAVIDPRYYSGTFSQLKFVQTYSCFPGSNIWPSTFYGGVDSE